jgi:hypothetical protein
MKPPGRSKARASRRHKADCIADKKGKDPSCPACCGESAAENPREVHMAYLAAFRKGVTGSAIPDGWKLPGRLKAHIDRGLADGRAAISEAHMRELRRLGVSKREHEMWSFR